MKILNFRRVETLGGTEYAEILVRYGYFWKKVVPIYKERYSKLWKKESNGSFCHGHAVEKLAAKYDKETS